MYESNTTAGGGAVCACAGTAAVASTNALTQAVRLKTCTRDYSPDRLMYWYPLCTTALMPQNREEPNPASAKEQAEESREDVNVDCPPDCGPNEFEGRADLDGKTDSGPEPDVFGREIPPQD